MERTSFQLPSLASFMRAAFKQNKTTDFIFRPHIFLEKYGRKIIQRTEWLLLLSITSLLAQFSFCTSSRKSAVNNFLKVIEIDVNGCLYGASRAEIIFPKQSSIPVQLKILAKRNPKRVPPLPPLCT